MNIPRPLITHISVGPFHRPAYAESHLPHVDKSDAVFTHLYYTVPGTARPMVIGIVLAATVSATTIHRKVLRVRLRINCGDLYENFICFALSKPLMTVFSGFNWPVEHDHTVGVMGGGEFLFASVEVRWTRHGRSPVLNTSFNLAGEHLVETPLDEIKSLAPGGLRQYTYKDGSYRSLVINYVLKVSP